MAVKIELIRDGRVSVAHYDKNLTIDDIESAFKQLTPLLDNTSAPMHSIADFSEVSTIPPKLLSLARSHDKEIHHPMMGSYIVVTHNAFLRTMLNTIGRFMPGISLKMVSTMDEALAEVDKVLAAEVQVKPT